MVDRVQLNVECYMPLDGQWQIVLAGTVFDCPTASTFGSATKLTESAGTLASHGKPTPVRSVRTR